MILNSSRTNQRRKINEGLKNCILFHVLILQFNSPNFSSFFNTSEKKMVKIIFSRTFSMAPRIFFPFHWGSYLRIFHISFSWWSFTGVSRTLLSILTVFNNVVVWIVSKSSSLLNNPLVTVPKASITIIIIIIPFVYWWSFTGVWATASFLMIPGFFSAFWSMLTIL